MLYALVPLPPIPDHIPAGGYPERRLFTVTEAAAQLGYSAKMVRSRIQRGEIAAVRQGGEVRIKAVDLAAYIAALPKVARTEKPRPVLPFGSVETDAGMIVIQRDRAPNTKHPDFVITRDRRSRAEVQAEREARARSRMTPK
jgi:excisionase family DNA binding protein